ncbi:MAG: hypothetical protein RBT80_14975 [Candidatus Vecturithrix sp.]|nr:hypothetical protein [Candidatus Vecturithrix sp.]
MRNAYLWKIESGKKEPEKLCKAQGFFHQISPDKEFVVMTKWLNNSRTIALLHVATEQLKFLPIPSKQSFRPMWSPDGKHIAFNFIGNDHIWRVGVIDIDGKNFDVLSDASQKNVWTFLGGWTGSGKSIFLYDDTTIYEVDLQKNIISTLQWNNLKGGKPIFNGGTTFSISQDDHYMLYNTVVEDEYIKGIMGPIDAIFLYNKKTGISRRVSPRGMFASEPCWLLGSSEFIYIGTTEKDVRPNGINTNNYKSSLEQLESFILVEQAKYISVFMLE